MSETPNVYSSPLHFKKVLTVAAFAGVHVACLAAIWTGVGAVDLALFAGLYALRMFAVTAGYHRYFSHRTYRMGRVMQFIMAFLAMSTAQKGVLWWAASHRHHHRHSDQPEDLHSPIQRGFWWSHLGWFLSTRYNQTNVRAVKDLERFPELRLLERFDLVPPILMGAAVWALFGWSGLVVGFLWSTVAVWHVTFTINSLSHVWGSRRYETRDTSRNNWILALLTFGEGWHNNHHHYQASTRQGFRWWEIDLTYYALRGLQALGLVRDLREPPRHVVENRPHPGRAPAGARSRPA